MSSVMNACEDAPFLIARLLPLNCTFLSESDQVVEIAFKYFKRLIF